jgi:hypothetical protein
MAAEESSEGVASEPVPGWNGERFASFSSTRNPAAHSRRLLANFPSLELQLKLGGERDLELDGNAGVLLGPELSQEFRDPFPHGEQAVNRGVAGGAERQ